MGLLVQANNYKIRPTQNELYYERLEFYQKYPELSIPIPVGRDLCYDFDFFLIDGHHNMSYHLLTNQNPLLWIAESNKDHIPLDMFPDNYRKYILNCNEEIKKRFDYAQFYMPTNDYGQEITTLVDLLKEIKSKKE